ncbi:Noc2-domain-containing protein [Histomonas meleagridis]|uniref:Noc2-domain-containing protein n=1 Tax=Histomonas meleagridis TaxID=135588 RepID=UPI00355A97A8|nr:Noc2-domain-containing protein [Histomonas meleagridis]KAH0801451.1 Noc2-domain-containing protein [Histomonas meleagridis]
MEENIAINKKEELSKLEKGDFDAIPNLLQVFIENNNEDLLIEIGINITKNAKPGMWLSQGQGIVMFVQAAFFSKKAIATLAPIFEQISLLEYTQHIFTTVTKAMISNPDQAVQILLFISSRAVQHTPTFYTYAIGTIVATTSVDAENPLFPATSQAFKYFVDFEPEATIGPLEKSMTDVIHFLASQNRENFTVFATPRYVNTMKFWSPFMFQYTNYANAFVDVALHVIHVDSSLKLNPFRLQILRILIENRQYLPCVAPLAKILGKSLQEKNTSEIDFDWDNLLVANKEIARTVKYQENLFHTSLELLDICLTELGNKVAFPEIVAPVNRVIKNMRENPVYQSKEREINKFAKKIERNSRWITEQREKEANQTEFNIRETSIIEGKAPIQN